MNLSCSYQKGFWTQVQNPTSCCCHTLWGEAVNQHQKCFLGTDWKILEFSKVSDKILDLFCEQCSEGCAPPQSLLLLPSGISHLTLWLLGKLSWRWPLSSERVLGLYLWKFWIILSIREDRYNGIDVFEDWFSITSYNIYSTYSSSPFSWNIASSF